MYTWVQVAKGVFEALLNEESRFPLRAEQQGDGWIASVGGHELNEGAKLRTLADAQMEAEYSYNNYYVDFEDPA